MSVFVTIELCGWLCPRLQEPRVITAVMTASGAGSALTPATRWWSLLAVPLQCLPLAFRLSGEHRRGVRQQKRGAPACVCACVHVRVFVVSLVSCNHQHTYPCAQAMPAPVSFVGALPFGTVPRGGICPSRRQQLHARERVSSWVPSPPWLTWQC